MEQLRLGYPGRETPHPVARLLFGLGALIVGLAVIAVVVFVVLPLLGIIVSAAVGGVLLTLAGIIMMIPLILVAGTVLVIMARNQNRLPRTYRARAGTVWRRRAG
ncbi:MAG TPA: hypothetical protein VFA81_03765 [Burkholderiales bacterium]|nr:hypothetical protein [Burkholderiales bacterium]